MVGSSASQGPCCAPVDSGQEILRRVVLGRDTSNGFHPEDGGSLGHAVESKTALESLIIFIVGGVPGT